jgi:FixJ family two-component response regulator
VTQKRPLVCVVDDDESVRESLPDLLGVLGFDAQAFSSAEEFLTSPYLDQADCLIADVAMPGPELQAELTRRGGKLPIVFITARIDEDVRRNVVKRGAVACLFKPFTEQDLLDALGLALMKW